MLLAYVIVNRRCASRFHLFLLLIHLELYLKGEKGLDSDDQTCRNSQLRPHLNT